MFSLKFYTFLHFWKDWHFEPINLFIRPRFLGSVSMISPLLTIWILCILTHRNFSQLVDWCCQFQLIQVQESLLVKLWLFPVITTLNPRSTMWNTTIIAGCCGTMLYSHRCCRFESTCNVPTTHATKTTCVKIILLWNLCQKMFDKNVENTSRLQSYFL